MKRITLLPAKGYGSYRVTIRYRGKEYFTTTNNMPAVDRYRDTDMPDRAKDGVGYTRNQAAEALYDEVKRAHDLR